MFMIVIMKRGSNTRRFRGMGRSVIAIVALDKKGNQLMNLLQKRVSKNLFNQSLIRISIQLLCTMTFR